MCRWNEWLTFPVNYSTLPLSSQLAITIWDLSPTKGYGVRGHAVPFGGTTVPIFEKDNTLQKGRQKCHVHRCRAADGLSSTATPAVLPLRRSDKNTKISQQAGDSELDELDRLEKLFKKHEMGEIPRVDWLDILVFRGAEKRGSHRLDGAKRPRGKPKDTEISATHDSQSGKQKVLDSTGVVDRATKLENSDGKVDRQEDENDFVLYIDFLRFDFPIVFTDHEYPAAPISSHPHSTPTSSNITLKPPPQVELGPGIDRIGDGGDAYGYGGRLMRVYDPEVGARDNPAESKHRRLVRSHRTGLLDRDLKPNAKIRDELNVCSPASNFLTNGKSHSICRLFLLLIIGYYGIWPHA
jgi:phosphatidylinositol 3-kinase